MNRVSSLLLAGIGRGKAQIDGEEVVLPYEEDHPKDSQLEIRAIPDEGWLFKEWQLLGSIVFDETITLAMNTDKSATAVFTPASTITITAIPEPPEYGMVNDASFFEAKYLPGDEVWLEASAEESCEFINWTGDVPEGVDSEVSTMVFIADIDRHLIANFTRPSTPTVDITAEASPTECGTVTGMGTYEVGQEVRLEAESSQCCDFLKWEGDVPDGVDDTGNPLIFSADEDRHLVALFVIKEFEITAEASPTDGGIVTGTGTYLCGYEVTLEASATTGWGFVRWFGDVPDGADDTDNSITFYAFESRYLVAVFVKIE